MIFGEIATIDAEGAYLAHSVRSDRIRLKKGHLVDASDVAALKVAGVERLTVVKLDGNDVHEEDAARRVGAAVSGKGIRTDRPFTGRVNLFADENGLMVANERLINSLNHMHPAVTIACLSNYCPVEKGRMVATVKIIPFAAPEAAVVAAEAFGAMVRIEPFLPKKVVLVATMLSSLKPETMDKTRLVLEERLAIADAQLIDEIRVDHSRPAIETGLREALHQEPDLIVLFGASATVDNNDVGPAGLKAAGGQLHHFGMPVDPGNLLFLGDLEGISVIGAPGCARSPAENGFDWIMNRLLAGVPVTREDIMSLGVGGLLMEIVSRPQPRVGDIRGREKIAAVILAAGRSSRMGGPNKLLARLDNKTLVRRVANALQDSKIDEVIVVTGHMREEVETELSDLNVRFVYNPDYAQGLSTSLRTGIGALDEDIDAALIALGDMPFVSSGAFNLVIETYLGDDDMFAVVSTSNGKRGNPVLWSRRFFDDLKAIHGDTGARHLIGQNETVIAEAEIGEAAMLDLDTPEALSAVGGETTC